LRLSVPRAAPAELAAELFREPRKETKVPVAEEVRALEAASEFFSRVQAQAPREPMLAREKAPAERNAA
jgi:hypothetical protein